MLIFQQMAIAYHLKVLVNHVKTSFTPRRRFVPISFDLCIRQLDSSTQGVQSVSGQCEIILHASQTWELLPIAFEFGSVNYLP